MSWHDHFVLMIDLKNNYFNLVLPLYLFFSSTNIFTFSSFFSTRTYYYYFCNYCIEPDYKSMLLVNNFFNSLLRSSLFPLFVWQWVNMNKIVFKTSFQKHYSCFVMLLLTSTTLRSINIVQLKSSISFFGLIYIYIIKLFLIILRIALLSTNLWIILSCLEIYFWRTYSLSKMKVIVPY